MSKEFEINDKTERAVRGKPLTVENLEILARERIYAPIIEEFYGEFVENGTHQSLMEILNKVPFKYHPPILHTLTTHVTKEKPIFVYGIGIHHFKDKDKVRFIASNVDLLWCLSLMVDDIIDEDTSRANRATSWCIYGREETYKSAEAVFGILQDLTAKNLSRPARELLVESVEDGLSSLKDSAVRNLDSSAHDILSNIDRRARFHCEYPIKALLSNKEDQEMVSFAIEGLFCVNRAGQILNDVKDLLPSDIYGRDLFSDIRSGTATVPLLLLQEKLTGVEKEVLRECFDNPSLTERQASQLKSIIAERLPREHIFSLVSENYGQFLRFMEAVITPEYFPFCHKWVDYKLAQANKLLSNPAK